MAQEPQTYKNHGQVIPLYHGFVFFTFAANFFWAGWQLLQGPGVGTAIGLVMAVALIVFFFYARVFALKVQDRVIRLEMRLRLKEVLPADMQQHIPTLTVGQLVALRFASDSELPGLLAAVIKDGIADQKTIKQMVKDWQGDYLRA
jgi:hypothetical protein